MEKKFKAGDIIEFIPTKNLRLYLIENKCYYLDGRIRKGNISSNTKLYKKITNIKIISKLFGITNV